MIIKCERERERERKKKVKSIILHTYAHTLFFDLILHVTHIF
jgi:hypothetical protein